MKLHLGDIQSMKTGPNEKGRRRKGGAYMQLWGMTTFKEQAKGGKHTKKTEVGESEDKPGESLKCMEKSFQSPRGQ